VGVSTRETQLKYRVGFNLIPGIGPARLKLLEDYFGDLGLAWRASPAELYAAGLDRKVIKALTTHRSRINPDAELEKLSQAGVTAIGLDDPAYPPLLRHIHHPPPLLYVKGRLDPADEWSVAIVGTRRASAYGKEVARRLAFDLAASRITIVSGLARGIDGQAHQAAVEAGGRTIAVLGCGVDCIYPPEHAKLASAIAEQGALISDYPLGTPPEPVNFPPRNRIISGMSLGTVIVEADVGSGAMITAEFALEQDRDVFAVPGNIYNRGSQGPNKLIQQGAKLVMEVTDILEELNLTMVAQHREVQSIVPETETESILLKHLSTEPIHVDELRRESGLPISTVSSTLALMELKGMIRQVGGMNYVLAREARVTYTVE